MLYTDEIFVTQNDLIRIESEIPDVATTETIDLDEHILTCYEEFADWLYSQIQASSGYLPPFSVPLSNAMAVAALITQSSNRTRTSLSQVCVTDGEFPGRTSALKRLVVYETVEKFYRQASRRRDVDRYEEKMNGYREDIVNRYKPRLIMAGLPIVFKPFFCPGALLEPNSGTWSDANLTALSTTPGTDAHIDVAVTWVDQSVYVSPLAPAQGESGPSQRATIGLTTGDSGVVNIANLNAPNGVYRAAQLSNVPVTPMNTTGWNVYAGPKDGVLTLQNASPIPYATKSYNLLVSLLTNGQQVGVGQYPDMKIPLDATRKRA